MTGPKEPDSSTSSRSTLDDNLLSELERVDDVIAGPPTAYDIEAQSEFSPGDYMQIVGAWNKVLDQAGFTFRSGQLSDDELIEPIRRVAKEIGHFPTNRGITKRGGISARYYYLKFDSWEAVFQAADLELPSERQSKNHLQNELRWLDEQLAHTLHPDDILKYSIYPPEEYLDEFDTWSQVATRTGVRIRESKSDRPTSVSSERSTGEKSSSPSAEPSNETRLSDEAKQILQEIERLEQELGHRPSVMEVNRYGDIGTSRLLSSFDSVEAAIDEADVPANRDLMPDGPVDEPPESGPDTVPSHTELLQELNWIRRRFGQADINSKVHDESVFETRDYVVQFGSIEEAVEILKQAGASEYVPRERLRIEVQELADRLGEPPGPVEFLLYSSLPIDKFMRKFDSLAETGVSTDTAPRKRPYSNEELISEFREAVERCDYRLTPFEIRPYLLLPLDTYIRRFESWIGVLSATLEEFPSPERTRRPTESSLTTLVFLDSRLRIEYEWEHESVLLDELHRLHYEFDRTPSVDTLQRFGRYPPSAYETAFGPWESVLDAAGLAPADRVDDDDEEQQLISTLDDLQRKREGLPTQNDLIAETRYTPVTYISFFGSWQAALQAAGLNPPDEHWVELDRVSTEELCEELRRLDTTTEKGVSEGRIRSEGRFSLMTYRDRFGSIQAACNEAGVPHHSPDIGISDGQSSASSKYTFTRDSLDSIPESPSDTDQMPDGSEASEGTVEERATSGDDSRPTRLDMLTELLGLAQTLDGTPDPSDLPEDSNVTLDMIRAKFGGWEAALEEANIK